MGLGAAQFTFDARKSDADAIRAIHAALDSGMRVIDTAAAYTRVDAAHSNENLVARAIATWTRPEDAFVVTKGGHYRAGENDFPIDGSRRALTKHIEGSLRALGTSAIDLYLLHWPDPTVPIEESVLVLEDFRRRGLVRSIGLSNVSIDEITRALDVANIAAVENHFSPLDEADRATIDWTADRGIAYLMYSPLGGAGARSFTIERPLFATIARTYDVTPQQVALRWELSLGDHVLPVSGATREQTVRESAAARSLALTPSELRALGGP